MATDGASAKFLYTILKQLDHKSVCQTTVSHCPSLLTLSQIDWNLVASELGITNGHAARMRFSRFKQTMEGVQPTRRPRAENHKQQKAKLEKRRKGGESEAAANVKKEDPSSVLSPRRERGIKSEEFVKEESVDSDYKMGGYQTDLGDFHSSDMGQHVLKAEDQDVY